jgi:excisionase family DNA binding protein
MKDKSPPPTKDAHEEYLTARQLAAILQVSEATVRRLARQGRIPCIRLTTRLTRFHLPSVRDALDGATRRTRRHASEEQIEDTQLSFTDML